MSLMLFRSLTYATCFMYLAAGTVAYRLVAPEMTEIKISSDYLNVFTKTQIPSSVTEKIEAPEVVFEEIKFQKDPAPKLNKITESKIEEKKEEKLFSYPVVSACELPFYEPVSLGPVYFKAELLTNLLALYKEIEVETQSFIAEFEKAGQPEAQVLAKDEVSTTQAKTQDVELEPEFFEYPQEKLVEATAGVVGEQRAEIVAEAVEAAQETTTETLAKAEELVQGSSRNVVESAPVSKTENIPAIVEEVSVGELITFDYSAAQKDLNTQKMPTVAKVVNQAKVSIPTPAPSPATQDEKSDDDMSGLVGDNSGKNVDNQKNLLKTKMYPTQMNIQVIGTNLEGTQVVNGFELRFQDDQNEILEDFGAGEVIYRDNLAKPKMTRSAVLLKPGYSPTNIDLVVEKGVPPLTSIPLIVEEVFNEFNEAYEPRGPVGAVLVKLDNEIETAELDVPFGKLLYLDENFKLTNNENFRYQLFVGVQAGNAMLSFKGTKYDLTSKIIHIHENELTFDAVDFENIKHKTVKLFEEDLLSKDKAPLIISSDEVKQFATNKTSKKINDHTYKMYFGKIPLGSRNYLELYHLSEPIFVGYRENPVIDVPSENFMRFILSRFENAKLGNRCLVQVNLSKKAERMEVGTESVAASLSTTTQVLDSDGKFYDSIGEKTRKIIVVGENTSSNEIDQNGKINIKIYYQDGSSQSIGTYCSPNTYLVEQL